MQEKWRVYNDSGIPEGHYEVLEILQNKNGTNIILESEKSKVLLKFGFIDALRVCDEGRRIKTYNEVEEIQTYRNDFVGVPLYLVDNSKFCQWIMKESAGFYTNGLHFAVVTINDIVDIISPYPPKIIVNLI